MSPYSHKMFQFVLTLGCYNWMAPMNFYSHEFSKDKNPYEDNSTNYVCNPFVFAESVKLFLRR